MVLPLCLTRLSAIPACSRDWYSQCHTGKAEPVGQLDNDQHGGEKRDVSECYLKVRQSVAEQRLEHFGVVHRIRGSDRLAVKKCTSSARIGHMRTRGSSYSCLTNTAVPIRFLWNTYNVLHPLLSLTPLFLQCSFLFHSRLSTLHHRYSSAHDCSRKGSVDGPWTTGHAS